MKTIHSPIKTDISATRYDNERATVLFWLLMFSVRRPWEILSRIVDDVDNILFCFDNLDENELSRHYTLIE